MSTEKRALGLSPFEHNHADPWATKTFVDLPELNARVTNAILGAITSIRSAASEGDAELRTTSLLVQGPAGAGKTHLFGRLRHKLGPKAVFVYLRPLVGTEMTPRYILGQIVQQLGYQTLGGEGALTQLDALVGSSLAHLEGAAPDFPSIFLDDVRALEPEARVEKLAWAVERLLERHQEIDETYVARLLEAPFMKPAQQRAALAWLAGRELEEPQMKRLGVTAGLPEERVVGALQTLGLFAAPGAPIVLVFDQLENLIDAEGTGARVRAYANLVAELFDSTRGFVLVQMALDSEWARAIRPVLSEAQRTRLGAREMLIALPSPLELRGLVQRWTDQIADRPEPFPWPFVEARVDAWSRTPGMTPRMLMNECRLAIALGPCAPFEPPAVEVDPPTQRAPIVSEQGDEDVALALAWDQHLGAARAALDEAARDRRSADPGRLVGGVAGALGFTGARPSRVDARQTVQLVAATNGASTSLVLLSQTHPKSAITAVDRAAEALSKGRVVAARERAIEFPPTWKKVQESLRTAIGRGLAWVILERDDTAKLLALESFLAAARSKDLEDERGHVIESEQVNAWVARTLDVPSWPLVRAIVGGTKVDDATADPPLDGRSEPPRVVRTTPPAVGDTRAILRACLTQLRVASLERLVREVTRVHTDVSRGEIIDALDAMQGHVRWFGRSIIAVREGGAS